jgi:ACT domain-containing protein
MLSQVKFITVAEAIKYLGVSRSAFEVYKSNDILRCQSEGEKSPIQVLLKDVENVKEVLERTKNEHLPFGFTRTWA